MKKNKVCWKITTKCNQGCKYCFGFYNIPDLSFEENMQVLDNLVNSGINSITWTGGEAVLYPKINELMKASKNKGLYNKLVTNGIYLSENDDERVNDIINILDEINISIDSIDNNINLSLGKENNHLEIVKNLLEKLNDKDIKVRVNTVVSKLNIDKLEELGEFLNNYNIEKWKFLKFMPVRERAERNKNSFEISEDEVEEKVKELKSFTNIKSIEYKRQNEFEKSIVILPNADVVQTRDGMDHYFGNILKQNYINFNNIHKTEEVTILIAHYDERTREMMKYFASDRPYAKIVGSAKSGEEAIEKIKELKPDMVFASFDMPDINGVEIVKRSKKALQDNVPIFNFIIKDDILSDEFKPEFIETKELIGDKFNSVISPMQTQERYDQILDDYIRYLNAIISNKFA